MLKGLGGLGDMAKMMKAAKEMQEKMGQMQADLDNIMVTGESGAGLVTATCTAKGELKGLEYLRQLKTPNKKPRRATNKRWHAWPKTWGCHPAWGCPVKRTEWWIEIQISTP
jgi:hypothetical protein